MRETVKKATHTPAEAREREGRHKGTAEKEGQHKGWEEEETMSRAQGDGFRTHTDYELNAYKWRLRNKLVKLIDHKEKWYRVGAGWILAEERNRMVNPNGSWRWRGWVVEAHEYWITVFPEECIEVREGKPVVIGWSVARKVIDDDKEGANRFFKTIALSLAKQLKTWISTEVDNRPAFDYEGRRAQAGIKIEGRMMSTSSCLWLTGRRR